MSVLEKYTVTAGNESGIEERADISGSGLKVSCMGLFEDRGLYLDR